MITSEHCIIALMHRNDDEELGIIPCHAAQFSRYLDRAADCGDTEALFLWAYYLYNAENG